MRVILLVLLTAALASPARADIGTVTIESNGGKTFVWFKFDVLKILNPPQHMVTTTNIYRQHVLGEQYAQAGGGMQDVPQVEVVEKKQTVPLFTRIKNHPVRSAVTIITTGLAGYFLYRGFTDRGGNTHVDVCLEF